MSMIAKSSGNTNVDRLPGGVYTAISSAIIDIGLQESKQFEKTQRKFMLIWNVVDEEIEINGEKLPRTISKEYSFSLHEKSRLRIDLQAWRGKMFTDDELQGFDLLNILNRACQMQIILEEKNGKTFNSVASIMALAKGQVVQNLASEDIYHFDLENQETWKNWGKIPNWIKDKIKLAKNYEESGLKEYVEQYEEEIKKQENNDNLLAPADDLPF